MVHCHCAVVIMLTLTAIEHGWGGWGWTCTLGKQCLSPRSLWFVPGVLVVPMVLVALLFFQFMSALLALPVDGGVAGFVRFGLGGIASQASDAIRCT